MKQSCNLQAKLQSKSIHLFQSNSYREYLNFTQNLDDNSEEIHESSAQISSINISLQKNTLLDSRELFNKQNKFINIQDDSKINIQDEETQETVNSFHSMLTKSSYSNPQKPNKNIYKQYFIQKNYLSSSQSQQSQRTNQSLTLSTNSIEIYKVDRSHKNHKEKNFLLELSLNQSKHFLDYDQLEHGSSQNNSLLQSIDKTDSYILKNSLQKRVTFQDLTSQETHQSYDDAMIRQQLSFSIKQETKMSGLGTLLIQLQQSYNGEKKKKIIFITRNYFYVLQDLYSPKHIQKFHNSEISKIIIHSYYKNVCSIIVGNTFQLNLQVNHFNEFIALIKDIFKSVLKTFLPIFQKQNQLLKVDHKLDNSKIQNNQSKLESFLRGQKKEFYIQIQQINCNKTQNAEPILGLLQFFQSDICITALSKSQELNRLIQVVLLHKDLIKKSFIFKSLKHSDQIFLVKLQDEKDFPHFLDAIESIYSQKKEIK
ncbi:hypothetical protein ABPG74_006656 [Tetrahymena malaccensis]